MLASALVEKAAVKAGLCVAGAVPDGLASMGLADLNRWYLYLWRLFPYRELVLADVSVSVAAGDGVVALPTALDGILTVRDANGALLPLCDATAADFSPVYLLSSGTPCRYVALADGVDADTKPVRRIRLAPMPSAALTLTVSGVRRFVELAAADSILLSRCEGALYYFVLGEMYRFDANSAGCTEAFATGDALAAASVVNETASAEADAQQVPTESFFG